MIIFQKWLFRYSEFRVKVTITTNDIKKRLQEIGALLKRKKNDRGGPTP